jgi:hypothetical protein
MLSDVAVIGGLMGVMVALLEVSHRLEAGPPGAPTTESALRDAGRGPEGSAVRAEYKRHGVDAGPTRRVPVGFGW